MSKVTKRQKEIIAEIDTIVKEIGADYKSINVDNIDKDAIIPLLNDIKRQIIVGEVVSAYTLIDEFLNFGLAKYFVNASRGSKKFKTFQHFILERIYLIQKLEANKEIYNLPDDVCKDIYKLNDLRNGLAHSFTPEDRLKSKPQYKGLNIFSIGGIKKFFEDKHELINFFMKKYYHIDTTNL